MEGNNTFIKVFLAIFFTIFIITWISPFAMMVAPFLKELNPIWYLIAAIVIVVIWIASSYNKFVHLAQKVNQSAGILFSAILLKAVLLQLVRSLQKDLILLHQYV